MSGILLIGYGNPCRLDDGLGPAVAQAIAEMDIDGIDVDSDYQLTVEDAVDISKHDAVIFADADVSGPEPFYFKKIKPAEHVSFSSHSISPTSLLGLVKNIYNIEVDAYVLGIRGYDFNEFEEKLSVKAQDNLKQALIFIEKIVRTKKFEEFNSTF